MDAKGLLEEHNEGRRDFAGAILLGADLQDAKLVGTNLQGALMRHADLRRADLRDADLQGADLRWADLRNADLRDVDLRDATLSDTDLRGVNLKGANLWNTSLTGARMEKTQGIAMSYVPGLSSRSDRLIAWQHDGVVCVKTGCFDDTLAQFAAAVLKAKDREIARLYIHQAYTLVDMFCETLKMYGE